MEWTQEYDREGIDTGNSILQISEGEYIVTGRTEFSLFVDYNIWLLRIGTQTHITAEIGINRPSNFCLHPSFPNPFNASTTISFELRNAGFVSLDIFDVTGRTVGVQNFEPLQQQMPAGQHSIVFDAEGLTSGIYFVSLQAGDFKQTQKIVLMK